MTATPTKTRTDTCMAVEWHAGIPGVDDLPGDPGYGVTCGKPATWLHVAHYDMRLVAQDGPEREVHVLTLCANHSAMMMEGDGMDPTLIDARYELLP